MGGLFFFSETLTAGPRCTEGAMRGLMQRALTIFMPVAAAAGVVMLFLYASVQQDLRTGANDPQVQMAEDAAARLDNGAAPGQVVPPGVTDLAISLAPFLIVFDGAGHPVASSGQLDGATPQPPSGMLNGVTGGRTEVTWAPRPEIREAAVVVPYRSGHVLVARSLRLVEEREAALSRLTVVGFLAVLALAALASCGSAWLALSRR